MRLDRALLIGVVGLLLYVSAQLVAPYLQFVLAAVVLAFVLEPLDQRLERRIGDAVSAFVVTVLGLVAIVVPFLIVAALVAEDAVAYAEFLQTQELEFTRAEQLVARYTGLEVSFESIVRSSGENAVQGVFGGAISVFTTAVHLLIGVAVLLFLLYYFVKDGDDFVGWLRGVAPLPDPVLDDLVDSVAGVTRAVLIGHVMIAFVQGIVAGVGLWFVGIPNVLFWTFVMVLLGLVPLVGSFAIWGPAGIWLVVQGEVVPGVGLLAYGTIVVGATDDVLRPLIVDRYARVNPTLILVGVVGGLAVWGFMGLFAGPIVMGSLREAIDVYADHYGRTHGQVHG